ncbi:lamin tail domain-containing protein [Candidatus Berkelbacteria bacterium]|nr:lamin tail domain-containing protein [Candidatus Berkelbacteria bacterium]
MSQWRLAGKIRRLSVWTLGLILGLVLLPSLATAKHRDEPRIVISEIGWAGSSVSTADEWLELANLGEGIVDLVGWSVWAVEDEPELLAEIEHGQIAPGGFFLIAHADSSHQFSAGQSVLRWTPDVVDQDLVLSNTRLALELRDSAGERVDEAGDGGAPFAGSSDGPVSLERILEDLDDGDEEDSWRPASLASGFDDGRPDLGTPTPSGRPILPALACRIVWAPGQAEAMVPIEPARSNGLPLPVTLTADGVVLPQTLAADGSAQVTLLRPASFGEQVLVAAVVSPLGLVSEESRPCLHTMQSRDLVITEVFPAPTGGQAEWVELTNQGTEPVALAGWQLDDDPDGGSVPYQFPAALSILPGASIVISGTDSSLALNNSGDQVILLDPTGSQVDAVTYGLARSGESWSRQTDVWAWAVPSPGQPNPIPPPPAEALFSVAAAPPVIVAQPAVGAPPQLSVETFVLGPRPEAGTRVIVDGIVSQPLGRYDDRLIVLASDSGEVALELQLPAGGVSEVAAGERLRVTGTVSRASTPRLLVGAVTDLERVGEGPPPHRQFAGIGRLLATVVAEGRLVVRDRERWLEGDGWAVQFSTRQGVRLPPMESGDAVTLAGIIVATDPYRIRVLDSREVTVVPAPLPEAEGGLAEFEVAVALGEPMPEPPTVPPDEPLTSVSGPVVASLPPLLAAVTGPTIQPYLYHSLVRLAGTVEAQRDQVRTLSAQVLAAQTTRPVATPSRISLLLAFLSSAGIIGVLLEWLWHSLASASPRFLR